jgi:hypothetical protein
MGAQKTAVELSVQSLVPKHRLGELYIDELGNHYRYMKAAATVTANHLFSYTPSTWTIDAVVKLAVNPADTKVCAICASPIAITNTYHAWVFVGPGLVTLTTAGNVSAKAIIYGVNGDGTVDDAAVALLLDGLTCVADITGATTGTFYAIKPLMGIDLP